MNGALPLITAKLSLAEYLGLEAVNWSLLRVLAERSPAHARHEQIHPEPPSGAMDLGSLAHGAILEPARFERDYIAMEHWLTTDGAGIHAHAAFLAVRRARLAKGEVASTGEKIDRVTSEGKALWRDFEHANAGKTVVSVEDYARLRGMIAAVQAHQTAAALIYGQGASEVTGAWLHNGVACKSRADRLAHAWGYLVDVDLKTTADAARFERTAASLGYHGQAAMRLAGWRAIAAAKGTEPPSRFIHVVIETEPPHGVRVVELKPASIAAGAEMFERAVTRWAECARSGVWPGYPDGGAEPVDLPRWALGAHAMEEL